MFQHASRDVGRERETRRFVGGRTLDTIRGSFVLPIRGQRSTPGCDVLLVQLGRALPVSMSSSRGLTRSRSATTTTRLIYSKKLEI